MRFESLGFAADYQTKQDPRAPVTIVFRTPRPEPKEGELVFESRMAESNGLVLEVTPEAGKPWVGLFEWGSGDFSGLFGTPRADVVCVVAGGQGFWVPTANPDAYEIVPSIPITRVCAISERNIIVFVDYVRITAYGKTGLLWRTNDLSWDGLKLTEISAETIRGLGWDSPKDQEVEFAVDVSTGKSRGGSSPSHYLKK